VVSPSVLVSPYFSQNAQDALRGILLLPCNAPWTKDRLHGALKSLVHNQPYIDAPIELATLRICIFGVGMSHPVAGRCKNAPHGDITVAAKIVCDCGRPILAKLLV
jgi:hypothetical protein